MKSTVTSRKSYPFGSMFSEDAMLIAKDFLTHEKQELKNLFVKEKDIDNIIVVGSGNGHYSDIAFNNNVKYIGIEPNYNVPTKEREGFHIVKKPFESISHHDLSRGKNLFVFWFNVSFYIDNYGDKLNELLRGGDVIFNSTWSRCKEGASVMDAYFKQVYIKYHSPFEYKNTVSEIINTQPLISRKIKNYTNMEIISNNINTIEIIYI
ncbi:hypothetical protein ACW5WN_04485 [Aeromonas lacus]